jgi:hypothetical protein
MERKFDKWDTVLLKHEGKKCLVLGDLILWNVGTEHSHLRVEYFLLNRTAQLHTVVDNRALGNPDTVLIHVGTKNLRRTSNNLVYVSGEVYSLMAKTKFKFPHCRLVLSGVVRSTDVMWRCIEVVNNRYDWVAKTLGVTFVDLNSWIEHGHFGRGQLNLNQRGVSRLGHLDSRLCKISGKRPIRGSK